MKNTILGIAALSLIILGASDAFAYRSYFNENNDAARQEFEIAANRMAATTNDSWALCPETTCQ